jgi:hypothetical protein
VRNSIRMLALLVMFGSPLVAEAGSRRGPVRRGYTQPQAYRKPQTITPENPAVVQARQQRLTKLKSDLEAIAPRTAPTREQTAAVYQDLMAVVDGSNKPAPATVQKLSADLANLMSRRAAKPPLDTQQLSRNLKVVMNSAYEMALSTHMATRSSEQLLKGAGAADADAKAIINDLTTITTQAAAQGPPGMIR